MKSFLKNYPLKRLCDIILSLIGITIFFIPVLIIGLTIKISSRGPLFHKENRLGKNKKPFVILKIRTLNCDAPVKSIEYINSPEKYYVSFGKILRQSGFDELPQLYNILKGDMSLVGPRPTLFDQTNLIELRQENNIYSMRPGLTGFAQINGRSGISQRTKVIFDKYYLENVSLWFDFKILMKTVPAILKEFELIKDNTELLINENQINHNSKKYQK
jgi:O-antigen biosynthesis protein WbqP